MMRNTRGWQRYLTDMVRVALGAIFVASGLTKIQQPYDFLADVYSYELVGPGLGYLVALGLPWLEFTLGLGLIGGIFPAGGLLLSTLLLLVFTVVKASAVHRQLQIGCGCQVTAVGDVVGVGDILVTASMFAVSAASYLAVLTRLRCEAIAPARQPRQGLGHSGLEDAVPFVGPAADGAAYPNG